MTKIIDSYNKVVEATLIGGDLRWANLHSEDLIGASLSVLSEATLIGGDLRWANLHSEDLIGGQPED